MCLCSILWKINNAEGKEYALALHFLSYLYQWVFCCISQKYSLHKSMCSFGGCDTLQGFAKIPWSNSDNQWTILVLFLIAAVSHCWLLWTCVSHQPPVRDSDIPVLPSARSHCTWTNPEGQGKNSIWDLLPVFGVKLGLRLFPNSFCPVSFQVVDLDNSGLQVLALQSRRECLAERKVCFPAQFLCLEIGASFQLKS